MPWQVVVSRIKWNLLQLSTMPGCVGVGVIIPLPAVVVVGGGVGGFVGVPSIATQSY
jgi:hypothetical protein